MRQPPRPDFFLVGAPKCGTTALSEYLRGHPRIFVSTPKEPFHFCDDLAGLPRTARREEYLELFRSAPPDTLACGEASAMYLYSRTALPKLRDFEPRARILVMLRNPVDLAHAFHSEMLYSQNEDVRDFGRAWELQEARRAGRHVPPLCWESGLLQYREVARLGTQMQRLLALFPREQVHVIVFDDFVRDPGAVYQEVLRFLEVPSDGRRSFPRINENKSVRHARLARFTQRPPRLLSQVARATKRAFGWDQLSFLGPLRSLNLRRAPRPPLPDALRARIAGELSDEVELLSRLLERDLRHWVRPASSLSEAAAR